MKQGILLFIMIFCALCNISVSAQTNPEVSYGRKGSTAVLALDWTADNYGTVQWQRSADNGTTWEDISGANSITYSFVLNDDGLYRVRIDGDPACDAFLLEREIRFLEMTVNAMYAYSTELEFEVTGVDFRDARIIEYGYCYNYQGMQRSYMDMPRVVLGEKPELNNKSFTFLARGLKPGTAYDVRVYFITDDGSVIFGPVRNATTTEGIVWTSEDWHITKNEVIARFELAGVDPSLGTPNVTFKFGRNENQLQTINCTKSSDGYYYTSALINGLEPGTEYIASAEVTIDGVEMAISKTVKTLSDYSKIQVDQEVKPVAHTIEWDRSKTLHQISPTNMQAEYPRILRVSEDTLLCAYHGGKSVSGDHWLNVYLQKSYDNGRTWTAPTILADKQDSNFGSGFHRFVNPEMIKLQNGWIIMSFVGNSTGNENNSQVMVITSKDGGNTWGDPVIVGRGRTWEPMIVQLPNGELELYVASEAHWWDMTPRPDPLPQEILFSRSTDNGVTWTELERACYSPDRRDGMPVATVLQGNKGVMFVIEIVNDYGFGSPSMVKRNLDEEWDKTPWDGVDSESRWKVNINNHGGAPYMVQLPTGEIVVSAHAGGTGVWQTSRPRIVIGDNTGHNFTSVMNPLTITEALPGDEGVYYNSLFVKDEETIWLVVTHSKYNGGNRLKGEIKYFEGKIVKIQ